MTYIEGVLHVPLYLLLFVAMSLPCGSMWVACGRRHVRVCLLCVWCVAGVAVFVVLTPFYIDYNINNNSDNDNNGRITASTRLTENGRFTDNNTMNIGRYLPVIRVVCSFIDIALTTATIVAVMNKLKKMQHGNDHSGGGHGNDKNNGGSHGNEQHNLHTEDNEEESTIFQKFKSSELFVPTLLGLNFFFLSALPTTYRLILTTRSPLGDLVIPFFLSTTSHLLSFYICVARDAEVKVVVSRMVNRLQSLLRGHSVEMVSVHDTEDEMREKWEMREMREMREMPDIGEMSSRYERRMKEILAEKTPVSATGC